MDTKIIVLNSTVLFAAVLKGADLTTVTAKVVRKQIEEKLGLDLGDRRKEIDSFIMAEIDEKVNNIL